MNVELLEDARRLWVVAPRHASCVARAVPGGGVEWCYLGTNGRQLAEVSRRLAGIKRISIGTELNQVARAIKQPFLDWIAAMGRRQRDKVAWWASRLAWKSPLATDFFLLVTYAQLVQAWLDGPRRGPVRIVIVEDPWLRRLLRRALAREAGVAFGGGDLRDRVLDAAYWLGRVPLAMGYALLSSLWTAMVVRLFAPRASERVGAPARSVLLYTWLDERCVSAPGKFRDPYTGRLEEILRARGESVRRLTPVVAPARLLVRVLREFPHLFIVTPRHFGLREIGRAACAWLRIDNRRALSTFRGWDCTPLLVRELLRERGSTGVYRSRLWYFAMCRMAARLGSTVKCIVYLFENQPWEKLLCLAWREHAPHVKLVGYQHTSVPPMLLSFFLGMGEIDAVPLPEQIVTNGAASLELLKAGGFPAAKLANGGALRYEHVSPLRAVCADRLAAANRGTEREKTVLVTFPISLSHAKSLLLGLLEQFEEPLFVGREGRRPVRLVLKCHPVLPLETLHPGGKLPPWISVSREPMDRALSRADLILYAPPTTTWWEAYLAGVPVLKYLTDLLDIDAELGNGSPVHVCSRETLRASIEALLRDPSARPQPDPRVLEATFGPVDEELWARVVGD